MTDILIAPPPGVIAILVAIGYAWAGLALVGGEFAKPPGQRPDYVERPSFFRTLRIVMLWPMGLRVGPAILTLLGHLAATVVVFLALGYFVQDPWLRAQGLAALFALLSLPLLFSRAPNKWR